MSTPLVITFSGRDRAGIVDAISSAIVAHDGNWEQSRSVRLAGYFAGVVLATLPTAEVDALEDDLKAIEGVTLAVARGDSDAALASEGRQMSLRLVGADHRGIVKQVAQILVGRGVSIHELQTSTESAPMDGGMLFRASATLTCPGDVDSAELSTALEKLADDLVVELSLT